MFPFHQNLQAKKQSNKMSWWLSGAVGAARVTLPSLLSYFTKSCVDMFVLSYFSEKNTYFRKKVANMYSRANSERREMNYSNKL